MKKNGFTLVELLAVIVILSIIVLIAAPIVSNIINESEESAAISSAELYLDAVENSMLYEKLENGLKIKDGIYKIMSNGNICLGRLSSGSCIGDVLEVGASGSLPNEGIIRLENGAMSKTSLKYDDLIVERAEKGEFTFSEDEYLKYYEEYEEIIFNPGDGNRNWYVIEETEDSFTLMLSENLYNPNDRYGEVVWYETDVEGDDENNNYGPLTALTTLNTLTSGWTNVPEIENYEYINNKYGEPIGYQKLNIKNGTTTVTSEDNAVNTIPGTTRARLMSVEELFNLASKENTNFKEENMRTFATNNFSELKQFLIEAAEMPLGDDVDTISKMLTEVRKYFVGFGSDHFALYFLIVNAVTNEYVSYDLTTMPSFLYSNLEEGDYWTISTTSMGSTSSDEVISLYYSDFVSFEVSNASNSRGIRPIITINK